MGWRLERIEDLHCVDWETGDYLSPEDTPGVNCDHCRQEHLKLYHVHNRKTGESKVVGFDCVTAACDGWAPSDSELTRAAKAVAREREAQRAEEVHEHASEIAEIVVERIPTPRPPDIEAWLATEIAGTKDTFAPASLWKDITHRAVSLALLLLARGERTETDRPGSRTKR